KTPRPYNEVFSITTKVFSDTFAFAANQYVWQRLSDLARFGERVKGTVPVRVVGRVSRWACFSAVALSAIRAVKNGFVWACRPIFIYKEARRICRRRSRFRDQAGFRCNSLQLRSCIATHRDHGQPVGFFDSAHHGENRFERHGARLDKVAL